MLDKEPTSSYYNEIDSFCCGVLRRRTADGSLPHGHIDERPIQLIDPRDLLDYRQLHLFAGIGGFAYASRLAGLPEDFSILTGGFPCQPFSVAGKRRGSADDRFLWPDMLRLICGTRPRWVLGENVPGIDDGKLVLDRVLSDLEESGYEGRAFEIPACGVDAPILRRRIWIIARRLGGSYLHERDGERLPGEPGPENPIASGPSFSLGLSEGVGRREGRAEPALREREHAFALPGSSCPMAGSAGSGRGSTGRASQEVSRSGALERLAGRRGYGLLQCADGKTRRIPEPESGIQLVASGIPQRMARLKAAGNAICPQVAAQIMRAMMELGS